MHSVLDSFAVLFEADETSPVDSLSLALILASQSLLLIPTSKLNALPSPPMSLSLHTQSQILQPHPEILGHRLKSIVFQSGSFFDLFPTRIMREDKCETSISVRACFPSLMLRLLTSISSYY